jgi:hypothetical protein
MFIELVFDEFEELCESFSEGYGSGLPDDVVMMGVIPYFMPFSCDLLEDLGLALGEFAEDEKGGGVSGFFEEVEGLGEVLEGGGVVVLWGAVVFAGVPVLKVDGEDVRWRLISR